MAELIEVNCPLHDHRTKSEFLFECPPNNWAQERPLRVERCEECGLLFFNPNIAVADRQAYHGKEYYIADPRGCIGYPNYIEEDHLGAKIYFGKLIYSWFSRLWKDKTRKPCSLLDIGCATGHMSKPFFDRGWRVVGIDFSKWAVDWGREHLGLELRCQDMDALFLDDEEIFDCVLFWDSLEHSQRPRALLRKIHQHSSKNMIMIIQMPDAAKYGDDPLHPFWSLYQHCFHYNKTSLERLLNLEGFGITRSLPSSQMDEMLIVAEKKGLKL